MSNRLVQILDFGRQVRLICDDASHPKSTGSVGDDEEPPLREHGYFPDFGGRADVERIEFVAYLLAMPVQDDAERKPAGDALSDHLLVAFFKDVKAQRGARHEHRAEWKEP